MITAAGVSFAYNHTPILTSVGLTAEPGRVVGVIGPNGSGKTTLLRILYNALPPQTGTVSIDDTPVPAMTRRALARRVAVVTQEPPPELPIKVADMVLLGRSPHRPSLQAYTTNDHHTAATALRHAGVRELSERSFATLSGGEKQRVLLARALAQQADHLLLDEPTNHLDIGYQHEIMHLVATLEVTTVVVLHDLNLAARYCDHLVLLDQGTVARTGTPREVLTPNVLEPIYHVSVRIVHEYTCPQLLFQPRPNNKDHQ